MSGPIFTRDANPSTHDSEMLILRADVGSFLWRSKNLQRNKFKLVCLVFDGSVKAQLAGGHLVEVLVS